MCSRCGADDLAHDFSGAAGVALRAADEVVDDGRVSEATMTELRDVFPDAPLLQEFLYLVAGYQMFATVSASTRRTAHEAAKQSTQWRPDGVGPR